MILKRLSISSCWFREMKIILTLETKKFNHKIQSQFSGASSWYNADYFLTTTFPLQNVPFLIYQHNVNFYKLHFSLLFARQLTE